MLFMVSKRLEANKVNNTMQFRSRTPCDAFSSMEDEGCARFDSKDKIIPTAKGNTLASSRAVLCAEQAREIFSYKCDHGCASLHAASANLARRYRVSSKAIRDIWKGRSWLDATYELWNVVDRPARRMLGRPKGRKDSKPRKTKSVNERKSGIFENKLEVRKEIAEAAIDASNDVTQNRKKEEQEIAFKNFDVMLSVSLPPILSGNNSLFQQSSGQQYCQQLPGVEWLLRSSFEDESQPCSPTQRFCGSTPTLNSFCSCAVWTFDEAKLRLPDLMH